MHSPDNKMKDEEAKMILNWAIRLLDCLNIADTTYYPIAIQELKEVRTIFFSKNKNNINKLCFDLNIYKLPATKKIFSLLSKTHKSCQTSVVSLSNS